MVENPEVLTIFGKTCRTKTNKRKYTTQKSKKTNNTGMNPRVHEWYASYKTPAMLQIESTCVGHHYIVYAT